MLRGAAKKKPVFFGYLSQMWVGGVADSQTDKQTLKERAPQLLRSRSGALVTQYTQINIFVGL